MRRRKDRIDDNQKEIVSLLRQVPGISVELGHDDILVGYMGRTFWFEIKTKNAISKKTGKTKGSSLKDSQKQLLETWEGHYEIVTSFNEIIKSIAGVK